MQFDGEPELISGLSEFRPLVSLPDMVMCGISFFIPLLILLGYSILREYNDKKSSGTDKKSKRK